MRRSGVLFVLLTALASCKLFFPDPPNHAGDYGKELKACEDASKTWSEYTACCTAIAGKYGRDADFCQEEGAF